MSITIRLSRTGRKNLPAYKIVVANTKDKRSGRYIDVLGYYNPSSTKDTFGIDKEKLTEWKGKGALVTEAIVKLSEGKYEYVKYKSGKKKASTSEEAQA